MVEDISNGNNSEKFTTAVDYLKHQEELEKEAKEILPLKFDKCTYDMGYIKQAVYICKTCTNGDAGFCYSCSISCHSQHEIVELFAKRNFCCDCGNKKFKQHCTLKNKENTINEKNKYNHNFSGRFCWCDKLYNPDEESLMFQCIICEDWFHDHCITNKEIPNNFEEFICRDCVNKYPFLKQYKNSKGVMPFSYSPLNNEENKKRKNEKSINEETKKIKIIDIMTVSDNDNETLTIDNKVNTNNIKDEKSNINKADNKSIINNENEKNVEKCNSKENNEVEINIHKDDKCKLDKNYKYDDNEILNLFCEDKWKTVLCNCKECMAMYEKYKIKFLSEDEDVYEPEKDDDLDDSLFERGIKKLNHVERVPVIECLSAFNNLKNDLKDYLKYFAENKKVVTESDIKSFFNERNITQ